MCRFTKQAQRAEPARNDKEGIATPGAPVVAAQAVSVSMSLARQSHESPDFTRGGKNEGPPHPGSIAQWHK